MPYIKVENVVKAYDPSTPILNDISMEISRGEFICIYGPNGCGKTTLLKILTGIDKDCQGSVRIGDKLPEQVHPGIVPQNYDLALLPWRNTIDNISLPLELDGLSRRELRKIVQAFMDKAGIKLPLYSPIYRLSGGQKQLVIITRALINQPELLVLDEPFASLDSTHIVQVADALIRLWELMGTTTVMVTHDLTSAVLLSDRLFLLSPRPAKVLYNQKITLPRPRTYKDPQFIKILNDLQRILLMDGK
jgi:NitT/TauT family transport system ATP-binding protein